MIYVPLNHEDYILYLVVLNPKMVRYTWISTNYIEYIKSVRECVNGTPHDTIVLFTHPCRCPVHYILQIPLWSCFWMLCDSFVFVEQVTEQKSTFIKKKFSSLPMPMSTKGFIVYIVSGFTFAVLSALFLTNHHKAAASLSSSRYGFGGINNRVWPVCVFFSSIF